MTALQTLDIIGNTKVLVRELKLFLLVPHFKKAIFLFILFCSIIFSSSAQNTRILFVVDGSGSMKEKWGDQTKWDIAKNTLIRLIDSVEKNNSNTQFGVRILGHQFPREPKNCLDTKLEIPFTQNRNPASVRATLDNIAPQGHTPISYALQQSATDFSENSSATNSIILITDGFETCDGDICKTATDLKSKRITINPYIIGLGVEPKYHEAFKCVGSFVDAKEEKTFVEIVQKIVTQVQRKTTVQINLLNDKGENVVTDIPFTLHDQMTSRPMYTYVHTFLKTGAPDTISIEPNGRYKLVIHSLPPLVKENIELAQGKHNIISMTVPQGNLQVNGKSLFNQQIVVRGNQLQIKNVQDINDARKYIVSKENQVEILTTPEIIFNKTDISQDKLTTQHIPNAGELYLLSNLQGSCSILLKEGNTLRKINEMTLNNAQRITYKLQPGNYILIGKKNGTHDALSFSKNISITSDKTTSISIP